MCTFRCFPIVLSLSLPCLEDACCSQSVTVKSVEPIKDSFVPRTVGTKEKPIAWKKSDAEVLYRASLALAALEATKGSQ